MITITDTAAAKLRELITSQEQPDLYLRLFIAPGGCEGFSYGMAFDSERHDDDQVIERGDVRVLVDATELAVPAGRPDRLHPVADGRGVHRAQPERRQHVRVRPLVQDAA